MSKANIDELLRSPERREGIFNRVTANEESRTIELAFSSDTPVERGYGFEILSHDERAVNLDRLKSGRANLLINHDPSDWVGVIESARIDDGKVGRAIVRFGNSARAKEVFQDVRDGILTSVSVGYMRDEMKLTRTGKDEPDEYTVTRWTPFEASLVTIPADETVGIGRSKEVVVKLDVKPTAAADPLKGDTTMDKSADTAVRTAEVVEDVKQDAVPTNAVDMEKSRRRAIENLCKANKLDDRYRDMWIHQGVSIEEISDDILRILEERGKSNPQPASKLGLSEKETRQFSLRRAVLAAADQNWKDAGYELECSRAVAKALNRAPDPKTFLVPFEVLEREIHQDRRDLTVATAGAGGYLVSTDNLGFIEMLRNRSVAFRMGARRLSGLTGNVTVPRQSAGSTAVWLANEASTITESAQTFVQMSLSPKSVGAYSEISRQLLLQSSPSAEGIVTDDLAQQVALAADLAVLSGSGASGQPLGITGTSGIGSVTGTSIDYAKILEFQTDVAASNVSPVRGGYVTTSAVAALLMQRSRFTNTDTPLWVGNVWDGNVSGFTAMSSNQMAAASMLFGDWQEVVVGEWGVLEVEVNPYANFQAGIIGVRAIYSMDVGVRRPFAFSLATSIT